MRPLVAEALSHQATEIAATAASQAIPEIAPFAPRRSEGPARLTLLLPGLSERHVFGGIATALQVFNRVRVHFGDARIVVLDEREITPCANAATAAGRCSCRRM